MMSIRPLVTLGTAALALALAGCAQTPVPRETLHPASSDPPAPSEQSASPVPTEIVGTIVRFTSEQTTVDVTIGEDNPTVRDFLSLLPVETVFEEFNGREKITYLDRDLTTDGSPGSDPADGDLIYFAPWGNLGFYYNADGIGYSDATIHIGTYAASADQLALLEGGPVRIELLAPQ